MADVNIAVILNEALDDERKAEATHVVNSNVLSNRSICNLRVVACGKSSSSASVKVAAIKPSLLIVAKNVAFEGLLNIANSRRWSDSVGTEPNERMRSSARELSGAAFNLRGVSRRMLPKMIPRVRTH